DDLVTGVQTCALPIYDREKRRDLRDRLELFLPAVAEIDRVRPESALPDDEQRPQHEKAGEHDAGHDPGEEQAPDRGLGRDAVEEIGRASCREKVKVSR